MRKYLFIMLAAIAFSACNNDEIHQSSSDPGRRVALLPAEKIETHFCYALDDEDLRLMKTAYYHLEEKYIDQYKYLYDKRKWYHDSIERTIHHTPLDFNNMRILFFTRTNTKALESLSEKELQGLGKFYDFDEATTEKVWLTQREEIENEELQFMLSDSAYTMHPGFFTARINGRVTVKANKPLFGQEAGSDISEHFTVETNSPCLPRGSFENFDFLFRYYDTENRPKALQDFFAEDTWFQTMYALRLCDIPDENPEEVTFTVSIPILCEYWRDYYMYGQPEVKTESRKLSASCTFHFGQLSDFEANYSRYAAENDQLEWKR